MKLTDSVKYLKGVGPAMAAKLAKLHLYTVQDVLFHLPLRYQDRTRLTPLGALQHGVEVVVEGEVEHAEIVFRRRRTLLIQISDGTGSLLLRFFYFNQSQKEALKRGTKVRCFGEARESKLGQFEIVHPEYRYADGLGEGMDETLTPIYPATEGVQQATLRKIALQAIAQLDEGLLPDLIPPSRSLSAYALADALKLVHTPTPDVSVYDLTEGIHPAQQRLAFEELLAHHLSMQQMRLQVQQEAAVSIIPQSTEMGFDKLSPLSLSKPVDQGGDSSDFLLEKQFRQQLPFQLTGAQERVLKDIKRDIALSYPALRLVQGDVGSGKTVVAAIAALNAIEAGQQAALMAPTELLAEQHYANLQSWCELLGVKVGWLSGRIKGKKREAVLQQFRDGEVQLALGTHALFQEDVEFQKLALLIVDEQHRFGVHQRLALREKGQCSGYSPHQIIMTATPIPRTLAMTAYADLDYSVIDELPPGRTPVKTVALPESKREQVIQRIREACKSGRQAYWVCTLIEESDVLQCQAAEDTATLLAEQMPEVKIALVHGRMKAAEKEQVMAAFKAGKIDLLVATTVIEVGVDVPNASLMIMENAERLGLSQLHQLRGRVGRGAVESSCVLLYKTPLGQKAKKRLDVMRSTNDGFIIAQEDLDMRGPGEVLGTRQTGMVNFRVADVVRDAELLDQVHSLAAEMLQQDHPNVRLIIERWLGSVQKFSNV